MRIFWSCTALLCALVGLALLVVDFLIETDAGRGLAAYLGPASGLIAPGATAISCTGLGLISAAVLRFNESFDMFLITASIALLTICVASFPNGILFAVTFAYIAHLVREAVWD